MDITNQVQNILSKAGNFIHGKDSEDNEIYSSIVEWKQESGLLAASANADASNNNCNDDTTKHASTVIEQNSNSQPPNRQEWYKTGYDYWEDEANCPATVDGVLGGFACLSQRDLKGSNKFLTDLKSQIRPELKFSMEENEGLPTCACECGAGIGRVSKGLLLPIGITQCDLVEPSPRLISSAPEYMGDRYSAKCRFFCMGLQDFEPKPQSYDIIWIQWVIGYLTDDDLVAFFKRCAVGLRKGGVVVIKDNTCEADAFIVDKDDASATRSLPYILALVELAGMRVVYQQYQEGFPDTIFPVPMLALEPK